jgi:hypothetical protein
MHVCMYVFTTGTWIGSVVCMHVCMCVCMYSPQELETLLDMCLYAMHVCMRACLYAYMHALIARIVPHIYVCAFVHVYV